jgi:hypothetical protein
VGRGEGTEVVMVEGLVVGGGEMGEVMAVGEVEMVEEMGVSEVVMGEALEVEMVEEMEVGAEVGALVEGAWVEGA